MEPRAALVKVTFKFSQANSTVKVGLTPSRTNGFDFGTNCTPLVF
jgi:hypothetical protein